MFASLDSLLSQTSRRYRDVDVPGVGTFRIRSLTESEKTDDYESGFVDAKGKHKRGSLVQAKRRLIALCLVDAAGELLVPPAKLDHFCEQLRKVDGLATGLLYNACMEHVGYSDADVEGLVDEAKKNSAAVPAVDSSTA
jgi:hypothetical protein